MQQALQDLGMMVSRNADVSLILDTLTRACTRASGSSG